MGSGNLHEFLIWPLELIQRSLYCKDNIRDTATFRRIANIREAHWIKTLKSLQPKGFNVILPIKIVNRRFPRPYRFNNHSKNNHNNATELTQQYSIDTTHNIISINLQRGPNFHIKKTLQTLLSLDSHQLQINVKSMSKMLILKILN